MKYIFSAFLIVVTSATLFAQTLNREERNPVNQFAFKIYNDLVPATSNFMFSPLSIHQAVAMLAEGSAGKTKEKLSELLAGAASSNSPDLFANALKPETKDALKLFNSAWHNEKFGLNKRYLELLQRKYYADVFTYSDNTIGQINREANNWVSSKTNNKIKELPLAITSGSLITLMNVAYFLAEWELEFKKKDTKKRTFSSITKTKQKIDFMYKRTQLAYFEDDDFQAVKLPYKENAYSMILVVPKQKFGLPSFEKKMDEKRFAQLLSPITYKEVILHLPKFKIESELLLSQSPVIADIFKAGSDFSLIDPLNRAIGGDIAHKTFIEIDEKKTEAAALSEVIVIGYGGGPVQLPPPKIVDADHPFLFFIIDNKTNSIAFMGRYADALK